MKEQREFARKYVKSALFEKEGWRPLVKVLTKNGLGGVDMDAGLQGVHTSFKLCYDIVSKLESTSGIDLKNSSICVLFNLEFVDVLVRDFGVPGKNITFVADSATEEHVACHWYGVTDIPRVTYDSKKKNGERINIMPKLNKQFDVVLMNPPYQAPTKDGNKGTSLWDKFVPLAFSLTKNEGFVSAVHPSGWRDASTTFKDAHVIRENDLQFLSVHNEKEGKKVFGTSTRFDWYVCQKRLYHGLTKMEEETGDIVNTDISILPCIPNYKSNMVNSFVAKKGEEKCEILYNSNAYRAGKDHMSKFECKKNCYPVVYSTPVAGPTLHWSSQNNNGHYGVSKFIFNPNRPIGFFVDYDGEYAMTQWCVGIVGDREYLDMVAEVFKNQKINGFADFMEATHFTDQIFNRRVFESFRKDFWKEFI